MTALNILLLDAAGTPHDWIDWQDYVTQKFKGNILRTYGDPNDMKRGGTSRISGERTEMEIFPVVSVKDFFKTKWKVPTLTNDRLFQRDRNLCAYCGRVFRSTKLTRDHVHARSTGGLDVWNNVVTACKDCNNEKDNMTIEQWDAKSRKLGMGERKLLYVPYTPSPFEELILSNRNILQSQMDVLQVYLPEHSRLKE